MRGVSLIEILLAFAVMGMTIAGVAVALYGAPATAQNLHLQHEALTKARAVLAQAHGKIPVPYSNTENTHQSILSVEEREDEALSTIRAKVFWKTVFKMPTSLSLETWGVNPETPPAACDSFVSAGWKTPLVLRSYRFNRTDLGNTVPLDSYRLRTITASPSKVVIAADPHSLSTAPTLFFFAAQGMSPELSLRAGFDNASTSRIGYSAVVSNEEYTYAGNGFGSKSSATCSDQVSCAQIHIFKDTEGKITRVRTLSFATSSAPFARTATGETATVSSLFYYKSYLFVGLEKTAGGSEFNIIDVRNPVKAQWVSGYSIGRSVNHILVRGPYAYVSTDHPTRELLVLDITVPESPVLVGEYDAPGAVGFGYGSASLARNSLVRLGRTYISNASELLVLNMRDPKNIQLVGEENIGTPKNPESVKGLVSMDTLTFALLTHTLQFWDTSSTSLQSFAASYELPDSSVGISLACRNGLLYVGRNTPAGVGVIDVLSSS